MIQATDRILTGLEYSSYVDKFNGECEKTGRFDMWNLASSAKPGDMVLVYIQQPVSAFIGICYVDSDAQLAPKSAEEFRDQPWFHVRDAELLPRGDVTRASLLERFPEWRYAVRPTKACFPNATTSAEQIMEVLDFFGMNDVAPGADGEVLEGLRREARVMLLTRNRALRDKVLRAANGICEACETDFTRLLDGMGVRALQVHHRKQLALNSVPVVTRAEDLAVVCANCHALVHYNPREAIAVETLRGLLRATR